MKNTLKKAAFLAVLAAAFTAAAALFAACESPLGDGPGRARSLSNPGPLYRISAGAFEHGAVGADPEEAAEGTTVTLTVRPEQGWRLVPGSLALSQENGGEAIKPDRLGRGKYAFAMPATNIRVGAAFEELPDDFEIIINDTPDGAISADHTEAEPGETIILTVEPDEGYGLEPGSLTVTQETYGDTTAVSPAGPDTYTFIMPEDSVTVSALFPVLIPVSSAADSGAGTLREAITLATGGELIAINLTAGNLITLETPLPTIDKSLTIQGNGVTLTPSANWTISDYSQMLTVNNADAVVKIRGVHFKDGRATDNGGALYHNAGNLTLESCIFSGNLNKIRSGLGSGGSIYGQDTLTLLGCTFYRNTTYSNSFSFNGGALNFYASGKVLTMTGNLFCGNMSTGVSYNEPVLSNLYGIVNASYNVVDVEFGTENRQCGWNAGTGDIYNPSVSAAPESFKTLGSVAPGKLPSPLPQAYPEADFYGQAVNAGGASGAVQAAAEHQSGYFALFLSVNDIARGSVSVTGSGMPDADGLFPAGSVTITAYPVAGQEVRDWLVDGISQGSTSPSLTLSLNDNTSVEVLFIRTGQTIIVYKFTDDGTPDVPGTLRWALDTAQENDRIVLQGVDPGVTTISLAPTSSPYWSLHIYNSLTIEGNGITLSPGPDWVPSISSNILTISSNTDTIVTIRQVHFKSGRSEAAGAAIVMTGSHLILESCIFSDNQSEGQNYGGGVISVQTAGKLTARGCTFYNNYAGRLPGAAVYYRTNDAPFVMTGNLFYGNVTGNYTKHVVYLYHRDPDDAAPSYNVVDRDAFGLEWWDIPRAGWDRGPGDYTFAEKGITGDPLDGCYRPVSALGGFIPSKPADFPETDFYGNVRSFPGAPGAVAETKQ